jgi:diazepam-binding inhibitor (GABA receptor modulator, acyl-CoA-binding protein)
MSEEFTFEQAVEIVKKLSSPPNNDEKKYLYGLYKQSIIGNVNIPQPSYFSFEARAKWGAWKFQEGKTIEQTKKEYAKLVVKLCQKYGKNK